jgi:ribosome-associated translation inhibitor RaiA
MYAAIDLVMDKLEKQIVKQKEKQKQPRRSIKDEAPAEGEDDDQE